MNRRSFLAVAGTTALGGCRSVRPLPFEDVGPRRVERVHAETTYDVEVSVSAEVLQEEITADEQARIELTVVWRGSETETFDELPASQYTAFDPSGLWLLRPSRETKRQDQQTWVPAKESRAFQGSIEGTEYDPGESVSREYDVWADPYDTAWIRPGEYHSREIAGQRRGWFTPWDFEIDVVAVDT